MPPMQRKKALEAGVDIDMMTSVYAANLCRLVEEGEVDEHLIDECCLRILELKNKLGLFENPYKDADAEKEKAYNLCPEHRALAKKCSGGILRPAEKRRCTAARHCEKDRIYRPVYQQS